MNGLWLAINLSLRTISGSNGSELMLTTNLNIVMDDLLNDRRRRRL